MARFEDGCYGSLKGVALIGKVLAGRCKMHYTRVAVGKGTIPEDLTPKTIAEPPGYVMDAQIASVSNPVDGECQVSVQVNSAFVEKGFYATWLVLYAEDPDEGEVAFTALCLESEPEWIRPSSSIVGKLAYFDIIAAIDDVDAVTATIDPDALVTMESVQQMIEDHDKDPDAHAGLLSQFVKAGEPGTPGSAVLLDETGKVPSEYLPDEVFDQNGVVTGVITIPASAWQADEDGMGAYRAEAACERSTAVHIPYVSLDSHSMETAESCGLCDKAEAADGVLRFWADSIPGGDITARVALFGPGGESAGGRYVLPSATATRLGGVKVGSGLNMDADGVLSVDTASEAEVEQMLAGALASENK